MFNQINKHSKYLVVGISIAILVTFIISFIDSDEEIARKTAERIAGYDYIREEIKKDNIKKREDAQKIITDANLCDEAMDLDKGTDKEPNGCNNLSTSENGQLGYDTIPKANAMETNSGTVTTAISVVPSNFQRTRKDEVIMENICSAAPNSPLCGKWELYARLQDITYSRYDKNSRIWEIMLGIAYAESHIGQNYTKDNVGGTCYGRNNWGGVKAKVLDSGKVVADQKLPDQYNCWLYKFNTIEDYWTSKVNIITQNYRACLSRDKPIECVSYNYVGNPKVAEPNWIKNVASFLVTDEMLNVGQP